MSRIFHVRLNLDEVSAHNDTFASDAERGEWLRGFLTAARGGACRFASDSPGSLGYGIGEQALTYARAFQEKQSAKGKASGEARKSNHGSTTDEPRLNHGSTTDEPNLNLSNNRIIEQSKERKNQQSNDKQHAANDVAVDEPSMVCGPIMVLKSGGIWQCPKKLAYKILDANRISKDEFLQEAEKAALWLETHASGRKTEAGMGRFLSGWIGRLSKPQAVAASFDDMGHGDHVPTAEQIAELTGP